MASGCPMMTMKTATEHPCFGGDHSKAGRIHLPVAPGCNIKCGFCERKFDCANESRPGVTSRVLTPEQAVERVRLVKRHMEKQGGAQLKVVGIAGPGDPLANPRTFETFRLVKEAFPGDDPVPVDQRPAPAGDDRHPQGTRPAQPDRDHQRPDPGNRCPGLRMDQGRRAAAGRRSGRCLLLERQFDGVRLAAAAGLLVKINHVYIPGVNDHETLDLAVKVRGLGATMMNIIPVIPIGLFREVEPPSAALMEMVRNQAELILSQARHCKQCRADAAGVVGQDLDLDKLSAIAS